MTPPDTFTSCWYRGTMATVAEIRAAAGRCLGKLGLAAGALAMLASSPALACSIAPVVVLEPDPNYDIRDQCRKVWRNRDEVLADLRKGYRGFIELREVTVALRGGLGKCKPRPDFAFELVDAAIKTPVRRSRLNSPYDLFSAWAPDDYPEERRREVSLGTWLLGSTWYRGICSSGGYTDSLPGGFEEDEVRSVLLSDDYWSASLERFGDNPARDRLILRALIDPESRYFDLNLARRLAPQFTANIKRDYSKPIIVEVAEALANPRLGKPDYEAAAELVSWYTPYVERYLEGEHLQRVQDLWTRIQQSRLSHSDPQVARSATLALLSGDPTYQAGVPFSEVLPAGSEIEILEGWPDALPPLRSPERWATSLAHNYPSRALREGVGGRVDYGIIFDPAGEFHSLHVTRSAGKILDSAAIRGAERYIRPRPKKLKLEGYSGRYVFVPLPSNIYRISWDKNEFPNHNVAKDYVVNIVSQPLRFEY